MAFTLATSITEVRALLNEASTYFWTDTEITNWIKQGCLDWCEKSLGLIKEDTIALVTDQYKYTASGSSYIDDAIQARTVEYANKALQRISFNQMRGHNQMALATTTPPKYYYDTYDGLVYTFYVEPTPPVAYNATNLTVLFACRTDDITTIPYEYQQTIFLYAASKAHAKDRQFADANVFWSQYITNISFSRTDREAQDEPVTLDSFRVR